MWLRAAGYAEVLNPGDTAKLDTDDLYAPFPSAFAYDLRQVIDYLTAPDGVPSGITKCCADLSRTRICDGIFQVRHLKKRPLNIMDFPCDDRIEAYRVAVFGRCGEPGEMLRTRCYMLVEYRIYVERDAPVEARLEYTFESAKPAEYSFLKRIEDCKRDQRFPDSSKNLPETIEHLPISLHYPWD